MYDGLSSITYVMQGRRDHPFSTHARTHTHRTAGRATGREGGGARQTKATVQGERKERVFLSFSLGFVSFGVDTLCRQRERDRETGAEERSYASHAFEQSLRTAARGPGRRQEGGRTLVVRERELESSFVSLCERNIVKVSFRCCASSGRTVDCCLCTCSCSDLAQRT